MKKHFRAVVFFVALAALTGLSLFSQQTGQPVGVVQFPTQAPTRFMDYAGGSNLTYLCLAPSINQTSHPEYYTYSLSVTAGTLTSIVVSADVGTVTTASAHGLMIGQKTTVSGSTTSALNAVYTVATIPSATTFTIATSGVGDATYNNGALTLSGEVPLLTSPIWSVQKFTYDGSNNLTGTQCANGSCQAMTNKCSDRATLAYK